MASKETWPEKNQLRVEKKQTNRENTCCTSDKELRNLIHGKLADTKDAKEYACIWNFWTIAPRGDGAESGLSSGTSGPIASRDDGAIFLTAAKTNKRSVRRGFFLTLEGSSSERTT